MGCCISLFSSRGITLQNNHQIGQNSNLHCNLYFIIILLFVEKFGLITVKRCGHSLNIAMVCHRYAYINSFSPTFCNYDIFIFNFYLILRVMHHLRKNDLNSRSMLKKNSVHRINSNHIISFFTLQTD